MIFILFWVAIQLSQKELCLRVTKSLSDVKYKSTDPLASNPTVCQGMPSVFTAWSLPTVNARPHLPSAGISHCASGFYTFFFSCFRLKLLWFNNFLWNLCHHSSLGQLDICLFINFVIHFVFNSLPIVANFFFPHFELFLKCWPDISFYPLLSLLSVYLNILLNGVRFTTGSDLVLHHTPFISLPILILFLFFKKSFITIFSLMSCLCFKSAWPLSVSLLSNLP